MRDPHSRGGRREPGNAFPLPPIQSVGFVEGLGLHRDLGVLKRIDLSAFERDVRGIAAPGQPLVPEAVGLALGLLAEGLPRQRQRQSKQDSQGECMCIHFLSPHEFRLT
jgi:hypothetical protein